MPLAQSWCLLLEISSLVVHVNTTDFVRPVMKSKRARQASKAKQSKTSRQKATDVSPKSGQQENKEPKSQKQKAKSTNLDLMTDHGLSCYSSWSISICPSTILVLCRSIAPWSPSLCSALLALLLAVVQLFLLLVVVKLLLLLLLLLFVFVALAWLLAPLLACSLESL